MCVQSEHAFGLKHIRSSHALLKRVSAVVGVSYRLGLSAGDKRKAVALFAFVLDSVASGNLAESELSLSDDLQQIVAGETLKEG